MKCGGEKFGGVKEGRVIYDGFGGVFFIVWRGEVGSIVIWTSM